MTTKRLRAVFDTNVFVSATLSKNPSSPTKELLARWQNDEFTLLTCDAIINELIEKLIERKIEQADIIILTAQLESLAELVVVPSEQIAHLVSEDADDDVIVACAVIGNADYLVTYDPHFEPLGDEYTGIKITKALPFLWAVRGDQPVDAT
jgi:uncharacterized protein